MSTPDTSPDDAPPIPQAEEPSPLPAMKSNRKTTTKPKSNNDNKTPKPQVAERVTSAASATSSRSTDNSNDTNWTVRNSFTADSPYFTSFCETEVKQLHVLSDSLQEIAARTHTLTKTGMMMSEASKRLSMSCKFIPTLVGPEDETEEERRERLAIMKQNQQIRKHAVGEEMANFLEVLGDVSV